MLANSSDAAHPVVRPMQVEQPVLPELRAATSGPVLSKEEVQAVEALFAQKQEQPASAALADLWLAGMLLHDLTHQVRPKSDEDEETADPAG